MQTIERHVQEQIGSMTFHCQDNLRAGRWGTVLTVGILYEVGLMGSGRLLQFGPLTLRMWLFLAGMVYVGWNAFLARKLYWDSILISSILAALLFVASALGLCFRADPSLVVEDIKPALYFFLLLFFEATIRARRDVEVAVAVIKRVGLLLCALYAVVFILLLSGILSFASLYVFADVFHDELFFRGDSGMFLYKGSIYIGIAFFFYIFHRSRTSKLAAVACVLGLIATGTRGFLAALVLTGLFYNAVSRTSLVRKALLLGSIAIVAIVGYSLISNPEAQQASDRERIITFRQVESRISPWSLLMGHGFGVGVPERPEHMESAFLEVFHKQGIAGLLWWAIVFMSLITRLRYALQTSERNLAYACFCSVLFVFIESWTNPWITNPIGMAALLVSLASLRVLSRSGKTSEFANV